MRTYKILTGVHYEGKGADGKPLAYYRGGPNGDTFQSEADILRHNVPGVAPRFELVGESVDNLETQTVKQLRELAEAEEIDLGAASRKDDIVAAIRGTRAIRGPQVAAESA